MTKPKEPEHSPKGTKDLLKEAERSGHGRTKDSAKEDYAEREDREAAVRRVMTPRDRGASKG